MYMYNSKFCFCFSTERGRKVVPVSQWLWSLGAFGGVGVIVNLSQNVFYEIFLIKKKKVEKLCTLLFIFLKINNDFNKFSKN